MSFASHFRRTLSLHSTRHTQSRRLVPIIYALFAMVVSSVFVCNGSAQSTARAHDQLRIRKPTQVYKQTEEKENILPDSRVSSKGSSPASSLLKRIIWTPLTWGRTAVRTLFVRPAKNVVRDGVAAKSESTVIKNGRPEDSMRVAGDTATIQPPGSEPENDGARIVYVQSWKKGNRRIVEKTVTLILNGNEDAVDLYIDGTDRKNLFKLTLTRAFVHTVRNPTVPGWSAFLSDEASADTPQRTLLSEEGPGVGDNFPREDWASVFCAIEEPNPVLDRNLYPIRMIRRFAIESFLLYMKVDDYHLDDKENKIEKLVLTVRIRNR